MWYITVNPATGICGKLQKLGHVCRNGGTCVGDLAEYKICECPPGYGGFDCSIDMQLEGKVQCSCCSLWDGGQYLELELKVTNCWRF